MADESEISWTRHTFNVWWGCARVSPGCVNCYADTLASRWGHDLWRRHGPRKPMADGYWRKPLKWNRDAPGRVFCGSMCDLFEDHPEPGVHAMQDEQRARLWDLIGQTPNLTWLLLTKRPENIAGMAPWSKHWPVNVMIGTSVEDQQRANERVPALTAVPGGPRTFLSCEPLLGPVDLSGSASRPTYWLTGRPYWGETEILSSGLQVQDIEVASSVSWVIAGGESGHGARPVHPDWLRSLRDQCLKAGVPFHLKQWGAWAPAQPGGWYSRTTMLRQDGTTYSPVQQQESEQDAYLYAPRSKGLRELDGRVWDEFPPAVTG